MIPELISLLADDNGEVRFFIAQALARLTGETQGRTPDAWRATRCQRVNPPIATGSPGGSRIKDRYASGKR